MKTPSSDERTGSDSPGLLRSVRRLALWCAGLMLATVVLSAYMRLVQAGLGCSPWPMCYGQQVLGSAATLGEPDTAVIAARLAHRIVASLVLVLVVVLVWTTRSLRQTHPRAARGALGLLCLTLALALLGYVTPGARVPAVTLGNLLGGFVMFALCWRLAHFDDTRDAGPQPLAAGASALLLLQAALGAGLSATFAAAACTSFGDCLATVAATHWDLRVLDPWRVPVLDGSARVNAPGALLHVLHRLGAVCVALMVIWLGARAWREGARRAATALWGLMAGAALLGWWSAAARLPLAPVLLHNLLAALLLAAVVRRI